jgi:hypothetical protein
MLLLEAPVQIFIIRNHPVKSEQLEDPLPAALRHFLAPFPVHQERQDGLEKIFLRFSQVTVPVMFYYFPESPGTVRHQRGACSHPFDNVQRERLVAMHSYIEVQRAESIMHLLMGDESGKNKRIKDP